MRRSRTVWYPLVVSVTVAWAFVATSADDTDDWIHALRPQGTPAETVTLAAAGQANCRILVPGRPTPQEQKAATELSRWLGDMTGATFAVQRETDRSDENSLTTISVGRTDLLRRTLPALADMDLGQEGIGIAVHQGDIFLVGGVRRGPIYAVFALLEEDLGCRWYSPDVSRIPHRPTLSFRPVERVFRPPLRIRDPYYRNAFDVEWSLRNRTNAYQANTPEMWGGHDNYLNGWFVHTFDRLISPQEQADKHPEYFSEIGGRRVHHVPGRRPGQLCLTNPDVQHLAEDRIRNLLKAHPTAELISISENDGRAGQCECRRCQAINKEEGGPSATLLRFVNQIAAGIAEEYPEVTLTTLAYGPTFSPPKTIAPRDNVVIRVCTDMHAWPHPFRMVTETDRLQKALKGWAALGANISIWDYTTHFGAYLKPWPNMPVVAENMRFYIEHRAKGIMLQGAYQSPGSDRAPMRCWVWAKQLWDPSRDTRALMRDFIFGYYDNAAPPIWQYNQLLWESWERYHEDPPETKGYPVTEATIVRAMQLFEKAEQLARGNEVLIERVRLAKLSVLYARLDLGVRTAEDVERYREMVDEFEHIAGKHRVTHLRERPRGLDRHLVRWRIRAGNATRPAPSPGSVIADDLEPRLATHLGDQSANIVEDPLADNGYAIRQPGTNTQWSIQWVIPTDQLDAEQTYALRVRMRLDKTGDQGRAFHAGVYRPADRSYPVATKHIHAEDVPHQAYRWFDIGTWLPRKGDFVYIAPDNTDHVDAVYTDRIEVVPKKQ